MKVNFSIRFPDNNTAVINCYVERNHGKKKQNEKYESVLLSFEGIIYLPATVLASVIKTKCNCGYRYCGCTIPGKMDRDST